MDEIIGKALSNHEINDALNGKVNIMTYQELTRYDNILDALGKHKNLVLLYETKNNSGHWICIFETPNKMISFFDSYALPPDDELYFVSDKFRIENNMYFPHLSKLLLECPRKIEYNHHQFQKLSPAINTCGRWCIVRLLLKNIPLKKFILCELYYPESGVTYDKIVNFKENT